MHTKIRSEFTVEDEVKGNTGLGAGSHKVWGVLEVERAQEGGNMDLGWKVEPLTEGSAKITPPSTNSACLGWINREYQVELEGEVTPGITAPWG